MAIRVGSISFDIEANTDDLRASIDVIREFKQNIDDWVGSAREGGERVAAAFAKQEQVIKRALQQTLNLNAEIKRFGEHDELIEANTKAFDRFVDEMTSGQLATLQFTRSVDAFNARLNRQARALKNIKAKQAGKDVSKLTEVVRQLESASVLAVGPLSGIGARIRALGAISNRSTLAVAALLGGITGALVGIVALGRGAVSATREFEKIEAGLIAATGTAGLARREFEFVTMTSRKLGLALASTAQQYSQLAAASRGTMLEGKGVREIFLGIATAATALKLNQEQAAGAFRAVQQMISKGRVQAEELRQQLAERLPGAVSIFARSMGVTTQELDTMLRKGQVGLEDLIKFGKELQDVFLTPAQKASLGLEAATQNLVTAFFMFRRRVDEVLQVSEAYKSTLNGLRFVVDGLSNNMEIAVAATAALSAAILTMTSFAVIAGIRKFGETLKIAGTAMLALATGGLAPMGALLFILKRVAVVAGLAAVAFGGFSAAMAKADTTTQVLTGDIEDFVRVQKAARASTDDVKDSLIQEAKARIAILRVRGAELAQIGETVQVLQEVLRQGDPLSGFFDAIRRFVGSVGHTTFGRIFANAFAESKSEAQLLEEQIKALEKGIDDLNALPSPDLDPDAEKLSTAYKKAARQVENLISKYDKFKGALAAIPKGIEAVKHALAEGDVDKILRGLGEGEIVKLKARMDQLGIAGDNVREMLTRLIVDTKSAEKAVREFEKAVERTPEELEKANIRLDEMRRRIDALRGGIETFRRFRRDLKLEKAIRDYTKGLEDAHVEQDVLNEKVAMFVELTKDVAEAQEVYDELVDFQKAAVEAFEDGFDRIGDSITDAFVEGSFALNNFKDLLASLEKELLRFLFQVEVLEPIKQALSGQVSKASATGGGFSGILGNLAGGLLGNLGGFFDFFSGANTASSVPGPHRARGGPVIAGQPYIVGERGREAFVPETDGMIVPSGAMGMTVNQTFVLPPGSTLPQATQAQVAAFAQQGMVRAMRRIR